MSADEGNEKGVSLTAAMTIRSESFIMIQSRSDKKVRSPLYPI